MVFPCVCGSLAVWLCGTAALTTTLAAGLLQEASQSAGVKLYSPSWRRTRMYEGPPPCIMYDSSPEIIWGHQFICVVSEGGWAATKVRAFSVTAPQLWNSLPNNLIAMSSLGFFPPCFKTHILNGFCMNGHCIHWWIGVEMEVRMGSSLFCCTTIFVLLINAILIILLVNIIQPSGMWSIDAGVIYCWIIYSYLSVFMIFIFII